MADLSIAIEMIIREAVERGELQNLPGEGKPIELRNLNPFETKEDRILNRLLAVSLAASGTLPVEILILKEIESVQNKLAECQADSEKKELLRKLEELRIKYDIQKEARLSFYYR